MFRRDAKIPVGGDGLAPKRVTMDTLGIALSGMQSASTRLAVSAHNVANLLTQGFHPQRATQSARSSGGSQAAVERAPVAAPVDLDREIISQIEAKTQFKASARVLRTEAEMRGSLLDLFA